MKEGSAWPISNEPRGSAGGCALMLLGLVLGYFMIRALAAQLWSERMGKPTDRIDVLEADMDAASSRATVNAEWAEGAGFEVLAEPPGGRARDPVLPDENSPQVSEGAGGSSAVLADLGTLDEEFLPTPEGLFARTSYLWSVGWFRELSTAEAARLVPALEADLGTYPSTLAELFGPLPSLDECRQALQDEEIQRGLELVAWSDYLYSAALEVPRRQRDPALARRIPLLRRRWEMAEDRLMTLLDQRSSWHGWLVTAQLYREWAK